MRVPIEVNIPVPNISIALPPTVPLMCNADEASRLFGISRSKLDKMRRIYADMPVKKVGGSALYLVPELYAWFRDYPGDISVD